MPCWRMARIALTAAAAPVSVVMHGTPAEVQRLLAAIDRNLADAAVAAVSDETRFDAAYKAVMQCALVAMLAAGYRPATSEPGHHQTMIQSLTLTLGVAHDVCVVLDALRKASDTSYYKGNDSLWVKVVSNGDPGTGAPGGGTTVLVSR